MTKQNELLQKYPQLIQELNFLLPKLKHSVTPEKVINWLNNFKDNEDIQKAMEVLFFLEYISVHDIVFYLNELLESLILEIEKKPIPIYTLYFVALVKKGNDGKSGSLMLYYLNKTGVIDSIKRSKKYKVIFTTNLDYEKVNLHDEIIYVDDIIGSGKTFSEIYEELHKPFVDQYKLNNILSLLSVIKLEEGEKLLKEQYSFIRVFSFTRYKIFDEVHTPFRYSYKRDDLLEFSTRCGNGLIREENILGFDDSQALLTFAHGCPNNTLSIIWADKEHWTPIYPRHASSRMEVAKEMKKSTTYWMSLINKFRIDITDITSLLDIKEDKGHMNQKTNNVAVFQCLCLINMISNNVPEITMPLILGITPGEFNEIKKIAIKAELIDSKTALSEKSIQLLRSLYKKGEGKSGNYFLKNNYEIMEKEEFVYL